MNDEIKEILEQLEWYRKIGKKDVYYPECVLPNKKAFILLDYITNLQQEKDTYKEQLRITHKDLEHYISRWEEADYDRHKLFEEIERLKLELSGYREAILRNDKLLGLQDYKSRCEKAIEYIKDQIRIDKALEYTEEYIRINDYIEMLNEERNDLLNILKSGSDKK